MKNDTQRGGKGVTFHLEKRRYDEGGECGGRNNPKQITTRNLVKIMVVVRVEAENTKTDPANQVKGLRKTNLPKRQLACHVKTKNRKYLSKISQLAAKLLR